MPITENHERVSDNFGFLFRGVRFVEKGENVHVILTESQGQDKSFKTCSHAIGWFEDTRVKLTALEPFRSYARNFGNGPVEVSLVPASEVAAADPYPVASLSSSAVPTLAPTVVGLSSSLGAGPIYQLSVPGTYLLAADAFVCSTAYTRIVVDTKLSNVWTRLMLHGGPVPSCSYFSAQLPQDTGHVWLQSNAPIYKKVLEEFETFSVRCEYLVAFQQTARSKISHQPTGFYQFGPLHIPWGASYRLEGPGLVLFSSGGGATERDSARFAVHHSRRSTSFGQLIAFVTFLTMAGMLLNSMLRLEVAMTLDDEQLQELLHDQGRDQDL